MFSVLCTVSTVTELRVDVFEREIRLPGHAEESLTATTPLRLQLELSSQMIRSLLYAQAVHLEGRHYCSNSNRLLKQARTMTGPAG